jgi:hypothetical protein
MGGFFIWSRTLGMIKVGNDSSASSCFAG